MGQVEEAEGCLTLLRHKLSATLRTLHLLKVDPLLLAWRDRDAALRAHRVHRLEHFGEFDFPSGHRKGDPTSFALSRHDVVCENSRHCPQLSGLAAR